MCVVLFTKGIGLRRAYLLDGALASGHDRRRTKQGAQSVLNGASTLQPFEVKHLHKAHACRLGTLPLLSVLVPNAALRVPKCAVILNADALGWHPNIYVKAAKHISIIVLNRNTKAFNKGRDLTLGVGRYFSASGTAMSIQMRKGFLREVAVLWAIQQHIVV